MLTSVNHSTARRHGIAVDYPTDAGIANDREVVAAFDFENAGWKRGLNVHAPGETIFSMPHSQRLAGYEPFQGKAVAVRVAPQKHYGGSLEYIFSQHNQQEPESIYFRYYLRFGDDWDGRGGKMPGFGGTYGRAGWGGKPSDGYNGWSARGSFRPAEGDRVLIGTYCYHADMKSKYGDVWPWREKGRGLIEKNRWYCIEQHLMLNTPGERDGVIRAWVDGRPAFEKTGIKFRNTPDLRIEKIWFNVYHGGKTPARSEDHVFFDNIVIAKKYIGPRLEKHKP